MFTNDLLKLSHFLNNNTSTGVNFLSGVRFAFAEGLVLRLVHFLSRKDLETRLSPLIFFSHKGGAAGLGWC